MQQEQQKTIKQWLKTIPDKEVRRKAIKNAIDYGTLNQEAQDYTLSGVISAAFRWGMSREGHPYWSDIAFNYSKQETNEDIYS